MTILYSRVERIRELGLKKSLIWLSNTLLRRVDKLLRNTYLLSKPTSLQIEPTTRCNLRCPICQYPVWDRSGMDLSLKDFKRIIDKIPFLISLNIQGIGEPLLHKDLFAMIEYCKKKKIIVGFITNGTLLTEKISQRIVDSGVDWIGISIDSTQKETYEKLRVGACFDTVLNNIKTLVKVRGSKQKPRVLLHFTGTMENIHELPAIVILAKELGVDGVEAQEVQVWGKEYFEKKLSKKRLIDIEMSRKFVNRARIIAEEKGLIFYWRGGKEGETHADPLLCRQMFNSAFITVDGYVTPCAGLPDPRVVNFGNLLTQNFDEIWNSESYQKMREMRLSGKIPECCRSCTNPQYVGQ